MFVSFFCGRTPSHAARRASSEETGVVDRNGIFTSSNCPAHDNLKLGLTVVCGHSFVNTGTDENHNVDEDPTGSHQPIQDDSTRRHIQTRTHAPFKDGIVVGTDVCVTSALSPFIRHPAYNQ